MNLGHNSSMKTLPIILNNKSILLIGAGDVAHQKATVLKRNNIDFKIIAKDINDAIREQSQNIVQKEFELSDLDSYDVVINATGNEAVTKMLLDAKKESNFLLNIVDKPELCDFYFAALLEYGALKIAVSSSGASPTIAKKVRDKIAKVVPKSLEKLTEDEFISRKNGKINTQEIAQKLDKLLAKVYLVGCGIGDVELLTIKAYRIIRSVDVVFIDHLISQEIIDIIPEGTKKVFVGKQKGFHSVKQADINKLLLEEAATGASIARLKSGDPYIFGRGSEEAISMIENGIQVEVISGISSAIAGPAAAGIAPTARGYATNMSIVSAHLAGNRVNLEWIPLLKLKNHTVIVLMGVSRANAIVEEARKIGVQESIKVAVISNASRENQSTGTGILSDLERLSKEAKRPAIIVFGEVVSLSSILPTT